MKGYIYICKIKNKPIYKIGRALDVAARESVLKIGNPFLSVIATKLTDDCVKTEKVIQDSVKSYHFQGEWYKLGKDQFDSLFESYGFSEYKKVEKIKKTEEEFLFSENRGDYHIFEKQKTIGGKKVYRWYYWFYDESGKQVQKACRGCKNRDEAEIYMSTGQPMKIKKIKYHIFEKPKKIGGKRAYRWYYWFYDNNGYQIQKACRGCNERHEAENYILNLAKSV